MFYFLIKYEKPFLLTGLEGQRRRNRQRSRCEQGSCYPATGDLLIGREDYLSASSTCGAERPERFCVVSYLEKDTKCFQCDSRQPWREGFNERSHKISNIVSSFKDRRNRWWQARNGEQDVTVQLDLEAEFHFTHLIMTFKTFRPKALLIERSYDFGKTWKVYRYFAQDCARSFPGVPRGPVRSLTDVICVQRYSAETPSTEGEVIFRVLPPFIRVDDPYSEKVQDLLKLTNLRVNLTELHTLGDTLLDSRPEIKEKYYYSMYDMTVRGSCSCYGHAARCLPVPGYDTRPDMVHGQCECQHNTKGLNCEMCQDFYNDLPWRPARQNQPNSCKRCNCNNHATQCHFDSAVYEATGRISGGVCDQCQHNTQGRNCQECATFYYQDPNRDIRDPEICQPCDCDPSGSELNGECDARTDELAGLEAGKCYCKKYATGSRCDKCIDNYWNLLQENPEGCEACTCNAIGTIGDFGCDQVTGLCRCKRYVTGRNCDACYPGFFGLSAKDYGCDPCDCDIGGSLSETCDQASGQCQCRPNIVGRQCDQPFPGYYYAGLDYYLYEGEHGQASGNGRVYLREPIPDAKYWTGTGYMLLTEGDSMEIMFSNIDFPMYYDLVLRYDPRMPEAWSDVRITVIRDEPIDPNGLCARYNPADDVKTVRLQPSNRFISVSPPTCFEPGKKYTIRIDLNRYKEGESTPQATVLIDSILLVPNTDSIPIFQGPGLPLYLKNQFTRYRCDQVQLGSLQSNIPDECKKHYFILCHYLTIIISACDCDLTGSLSRDCEPLGGQCQCKPNVVGRRCDQCAPGTYGFGPSGCQPCNCNDIGALDNFCNGTSGQCSCADNVGGQTCDVCIPGNWGFPQCRACQCNGHAETCDNLSGRCINCQDNTQGDYCERCLDFYYGEPRGARIPCQPCMCPGGPNSTLNHADQCSLDPRSRSFICDCKLGYQRPNCEICEENYYGNPLQEGGSCQRCICNNNIDFAMPGSCDRSTGECLKCLYNTEGYNCELCTAGYFGEASEQNCKQCVCSSLGTDMSLGECDRNNGQCPCLPNVIGQECDRCAVGYYNLSSGVGCSACNCDPTGSNSLECNQIDGQCDCKDDRGGRTCSDCADLLYGDPRDQCYDCACDRRGSRSLQCDRRTGQCECVRGVTGLKCDRCARGTTGELPYCVPCGECFDNWDRIIRVLRDQTASLVETASNIQSTGAIKAFDTEFKQMQSNINEIQSIISSSNLTQVDVRDIETMLDYIRRNLTENSKSINNVDEELSNTTARVQIGNTRIGVLKQQVADLKDLAERLRANATDIQARDVEGALNITREAERRSQDAQRLVDSTSPLLTDSERTRRRVEDLISQNGAQFDDKLKRNKAELDKLDNKVTDLGGRIANINNMVCGKPGDPCDVFCGGGGCNKCGGSNCGDGAVTKAESALDLANQAAEVLKIKEAEAEDLLSDVREAKRGAEEAKDDAQMAYDVAVSAKNQSESVRTNLEDLLNRISDFLQPQRASPNDVKKIAAEIMDMSISLTPKQIEDLASKINQTIQGLQNIDSILVDTRDDLNQARRLKQRADNASLDANAILKTAQEVLSALNGAKNAQEEASKAITQAQTDIKDAEADLTMIESETASAADKSNVSLAIIGKLKERLNELRLKFTQNDLNVKRAEEAAQMAVDLANKAERDANDLTNKYQDASNQLNQDYDSTTESQKRAKRLMERADLLAKNTQEKHNKLKKIQGEFDENQKNLVELSNLIDELNRRMEIYLMEIQDKAKYYRDC
ncbi:hypothetical protein LOTGIDRAFT_209765 [Lottia gigantea]|uniref:Laminin subunit beta-1 n=1 Tax=Lottia gigantea TaxID=225164 RepID=V4A8Q9_LOTGI|nr:hypothetical protein LOTGIDRAFT_209765 [Lottia gigantea]ESO91420.1 hypothetical protein LOTGIDRAFT_209765 [Lottia gigantea]